MKAQTTFGITGGIGSGKSYVCRYIEAAGFPVFYCDDTAKKIIRTDKEVKDALKGTVGSGVYDSDGVLQKSVLAAYICKGNEFAKKVDAIVHPRVRMAFNQWCAEQESKLLFMECALLFESGFNNLVDKTILVSSPLSIRLKRVCTRDGVTAAKAKEWMSLQMPEEEKAHRSDIIINNDGKHDILQQLRQLVDKSF